MIKNTTKALLVCNVLLIAIVIFYLTYTYTQKNKTVYVDNVKLFNDFSMTKELKNSGEKEFNLKKSKVDSLYSKLQYPGLSISEKKITMQQFVQYKEELEHFNQFFAAEQSTKIWARIKSYSAEFSKDRNYQLIIGSDNKQTILFADEEIDVTNDLITYLNKKYEGI
ncbi:OmpH family outer membrane protein [Flavobacterium sp. SLB02]|uniref:OmpH family outer membrane protein n=1 Tax=Flavobacterium sp. SLB02 TaxID=2665645 RepID=UPI001ABFBF01|nr:OmpH family outer membrane protein [Flavobacterium sp. SLB02]